MKYVLWTILWPIVFIIGMIGILLSPLSACFVSRRLHTDTVKRLGYKRVTLIRDRLVWWLTWLDTFDNPTDEYFYGMYDKTSKWTQTDYDNSRLIRWYCRVKWLQRNSMYTFNYKFFGIAKSSKLAWHYQAIKPLWFGYVNDINIGYKAHEGFDKLMYAGRIFGLRKTTAA